MVIQKPLIWLSALLVLLVAVAVVLLLRFQMGQVDPCTQQSRIELADTYPALAELLQRQHYESNQLLARQRSEDFMLNLEMSSEQVDLEEVLKASSQQINEVAVMRQQQRQAFEALCRELVPR
jgi:hypothetical protein